MKYLTIKLSILAFLFILSACSYQKEKAIKNTDEAVKATQSVDISHFTNDQSSFRAKLPKLAGKDIAFYVEHETLEERAQHFYLDIAQATPDQTFFKIFDSLSVSNPLNPLRWHLLNKVVMDADGALAEELSQLVKQKIEENPSEFTEMLLDTTYVGRMEVAKNYAFLLAHDIQKLEARDNKTVEDKLIIRAMLACSTCNDEQKAVLEHFFGMVDGLKD